MLVEEVNVLPSEQEGVEQVVNVAPNIDMPDEHANEADPIIQEIPVQVPPQVQDILD